MDHELLSDELTLTFDGQAPFSAPGRVWASFAPRPSSRFSMTFEGVDSDTSQLQTGLAVLRIGSASDEHGVIVSRVEADSLHGQFTGQPPLPTGVGVSLTYGVLNLDPMSMWLEDMTIENWHWSLTPQLGAGRGRRELRESLGVAETHGSVLRRMDSSTFVATDAIKVVDGWRLGMSFATGSRVGIWRQSLARQSGQSADWRALATPNVEPWYDHHRIVDAHDGAGIRELLGLVISRRANDPGQATVDELAINYAIEANGTAPVEMRIAAAGAGLELLAWDRLVEDGAHTDQSRAERKRQYKGRSAAANFALLLGDASIGLEPPAELCDLATSVAQSPTPGSGADAVAALRNQVMHPRRRSGVLSLPGEVWAVGWQLAVHYLELLILHRLGYMGSYSDRFRSKLVGESFAVPWAARPPPPS